MEVTGYLFLLVAVAVPLAVVGFEGCPTNEYQTWGQNCYLFRSLSSNFNAAQEACKTAGGHLTSVLDKSEKDYIRGKMYSLIRYNSAYWIGLSKEGKDKPFRWIDGSETKYMFWAPGEPNDKEGKENCVEMFHRLGNWNDIRCAKIAQGYVCKAKRLSEWKQYNGNEYFLSISESSGDKSWYNGRAFCQARGGDLISIQNDAERTQISQWLSQSKYDGALWVGLNRLSGNQWTWSDGSATGPITWVPGFPKFDRFGSLCAYMESKKSPGQYKNGHCGSKSGGFICKRRIGSVAPVTDTPTPAVSGYCPAGYFSAGGNKCLKVVLLQKENGIMFADAVSTCRNGPGRSPDLASFHSDKEAAYVTARLQDPSSPGLWIGLRRDDHGSSWLWTDSSPRDYEAWGPNEPSGSVDHCAEIWVLPGPAGTWNNIDCHSQRGYVCQTFKDPTNLVPTPNPTTPNQCASGYRPYWYGCYKASLDATTFAEGKRLCEADGGTIVTLHSPAENAAIRSIVLGLGRSVWIGFNDADGSGQYTWLDKWTVFYTNWGAGQPTRKAGGGCVIMRADGTWEDVVCTLQYPLICKTTTEPALTPPPVKDGLCPMGVRWEEYHDWCYYFETKKSRTFVDAGRDCLMKAATASLASIHNMQENQFIHQKFKEKKVTGSAWTGLIRSRQDKKFYWMDFSPLDYENWAPGEPNGQENNENCVEFYNSNYKKMWNDISCKSPRNYVCKAPKLPPAVTPVPVPGYCPEGWQVLGHNCFYLMPDKLTTWGSALDACKTASKGRGDLATINNPTEDDFVFGQMKTTTHLPVDKNYWIGLSKKDKDSPYLWTDGSKPVYTNWAPGEPNDKTGTQNCVEVYIDTGMWNDHDCNEFVSYVCKMPKIPHGLSGGAKAGISFGVIIGVVLIAILILFILFKMAIIGNPVEKLKSGFDNPFYKHQGDSTA